MVIIIITRYQQTRICDGKWDTKTYLRLKDKLEKQTFLMLTRRKECVIEWILLFWLITWWKIVKVKNWTNIWTLSEEKKLRNMKLTVIPVIALRTILLRIWSNLSNGWALYILFMMFNASIKAKFVLNSEFFLLDRLPYQS